MRIDRDSTLHTSIVPLVNIESTAQQLELENCYNSIISDLDKLKFFSEHRLAAESLEYSKHVKVGEKEKDESKLYFRIDFRS